MLAGFEEPHKRLTVIDFTVPPQSLGQFLSPDEQARAQRFRFPLLRERFRIGRGALRVLLGQACGISPQQLEFAYSANGKPSLPDFPNLQFNVSHSGDLWACAIGYGEPFGLDIEQATALPNRDALARRFFASAEHESIDRLPESDRQAAFFRCWTRKEAYLKATGEGLSKGLATVTVSCAEDEVSEVHDAASPDRWFARSFLPARGYQGAIVTRQQVSVITHHALALL